MGLPPTASKISTDTSNVTTFFFQFPNFTGTHTGATLSLGVNSPAGGGTGLSSFTAGDILYATGSTTLAKLAIGSPGNALTVSVGNLPQWATLTPSFSGLTVNAPVIAATSSTITTTTTGTTGQVFTSAGASSPPGWQTLSGTTAFASFNSSIVNTDSSTTTSATFVTASNSPAFTITPTITGTYKVYSAVPILLSAGAGSLGVARIKNSSGGATLLAESQGLSYLQAGTDAGASAYVQSTYTLTSGTTYVFDIQILSFASASPVSVGGMEAPFYMFCEGVGLPGGGTGITEAQVWARVAYGM